MFVIKQILDKRFHHPPIKIEYVMSNEISIKRRLMIVTVPDLIQQTN
jgi:hypothetical protein